MEFKIAGNGKTTLRINGENYTAFWNMRDRIKELFKRDSTLKMTSGILASDFGKSQGYMSLCLKRLYDQGILDRKRQGHGFIYWKQKS